MENQPKFLVPVEGTTTSIDAPSDSPKLSRKELINAFLFGLKANSINITPAAQKLINSLVSNPIVETPLVQEVDKSQVVEEVEKLDKVEINEDEKFKLQLNEGLKTYDLLIEQNMKSEVRRETGLADIRSKELEEAKRTYHLWISMSYQEQELLKNAITKDPMINQMSTWIDRPNVKDKTIPWNFLWAVYKLNLAQKKP